MDTTQRHYNLRRERQLEGIAAAKRRGVALPAAGVPPSRLASLARFAGAAKVSAIARLPPLVAFVHDLEATAQDDALEVLEQLLRGLFAEAARADRHPKAGDAPRAVIGIIGQALSGENPLWDADALKEAEGNMGRSVSACSTPRGLRPWHVRTPPEREPGDLRHRLPSLAGRIGKAEGQSR